LSVNILPQITVNRVSKLPGLKNFLGGMSQYPPRGEGAFSPFYQLQQVLTKERDLLQILLKALHAVYLQMPQSIENKQQ